MTRDTPGRGWPISLSILMVVFASLGSFVYWCARGIDEHIRARVVAELSRRFQSRVELGSLRVRVLPMVSVRGTDLIVHFHDRVDLPPMIEIKEFTYNLGLGSLFRKQRHISSVLLRNMVITIPAGEKRSAGVKAPKPRANCPQK